MRQARSRSGSRLSARRRSSYAARARVWRARALELRIERRDLARERLRRIGRGARDAAATRARRAVARARTTRGAPRASSAASAPAISPVQRAFSAALHHRHLDLDRRPRRRVRAQVALKDSPLDRSPVRPA